MTDNEIKVEVDRVQAELDKAEDEIVATRKRLHGQLDYFKTLCSHSDYHLDNFGKSANRCMQYLWQRGRVI